MTKLEGECYVCGRTLPVSRRVVGALIQTRPGLHYTGSFPCRGSFIDLDWRDVRTKKRAPFRVPALP